MRDLFRPLLVGLVVALALAARNAAGDAALLAALAGTEVPGSAVATIVVDQDRFVPDAATIVVEGREGSDIASRLVAGDDAVIFVALAQSAATLFSGEVTGIEPVFDAGARTQLAIRALNRLHRLAREAKTRTFDDVTDAEIVAIIAREHALAPEASGAPNIEHDHVFQHNQTDLEFLRVRAAPLGFDVWVEGTTLFFARRAPEPPVELAPRPASAEARLEIFHARLASSATVQKVTVRGWDPTGKEIAGSATAPTISLDPEDPDPGAIFGRSVEFVVEEPIASPAEADAIAKSKLEELMLSYVSAEAQAKGNPRLKAGVVVTVEGLDDRFNGKYLVTGATHQYSHAEGCDAGYTTMLRQRRDDLGLFRIPAVDDEVLVAFDQGDVDRPVIVGTLWNPDDSCAASPDWPVASAGER